MTLSTTIAAVLAGAGAVSARSGAGTSLDPVQPVLRPDGALAKDPLARLGGNGPWTACKSGPQAQRGVLASFQLRDCHF
jgi:hypothetical protein